jgi:hypothetical protein
MTVEDATIKLKSNPTVETMWSIVANGIRLGKRDKWHDEVYDVANAVRENNVVRFEIMSIQCLDIDDGNATQYFVFVLNGGDNCSNFLDDVLYPITDFLSILRKEGAESVDICDLMSDTSDNTYTWMLSFKHKKTA